MLPHSLYQMSRWMRCDTWHSKPAAASAAASAAVRGESPPAASPTMRPWPITCCTTPGSGDVQDACTTQPITCRNGIAAAIAPAGSSVRNRSPAQGPGMPEKNHHGTPFIAVSTMVSGPSSGAMRAATSGIAGPLTATTTRSCGPSCAGSSAARTSARSSRPALRSRIPCARSAASVAPRATALTSWSLRGETRADEAADGAGAVDADFHGRIRWTIGVSGPWATRACPPAANIGDRAARQLPVRNARRPRVGPLSRASRQSRADPASLETVSLTPCAPRSRSSTTTSTWRCRRRTGAPSRSRPTCACSRSRGATRTSSCRRSRPSPSSC